jgi:hypothetical protein
MGFNFDGHLDKGWFKKGTTIEVHDADRSSRYEVTSFEEQPDVTRFQAKPATGQPDVGEIEVRFRVGADGVGHFDRDIDLIVKTGKKGETTRQASDVTCLVE